jgi:leader peptidase (prepilin peptidase)/N-methyltransferase
MLLMSNILFSVFNFILGAIVGSFLNVVIYRVPRNESIIRPSSHCPVCGHPLKWYDMIPIFSYLALKGKCRYCGAKISIKYPSIEALTGFAFVGVGLRFGWSLQFFEYIIFSALLIAVGFTDLFDGVVPDIIVIPGAVVGLIFSALQGKAAFSSSIFGLLFLLGVFALIIVITRGGMGQGDATFGAMIGSFVGFKFSIEVLVLAFVLGAIIGSILIFASHKKGKDTMPFGPYLAIAAYIVSLYGYKILLMYTKLFAF